MAVCPMSGRQLGYDPHNRDSILRFGQLLTKRNVKDLLDTLAERKECRYCLELIARFSDATDRNKGIHGSLIEAYYCLPPDNESRPDFEHVGVELKTLPLKERKRAGDLAVKEPTSISMIDYRKLPDETWERATVRTKLQSVLFVVLAIDRENVLGTSVRDCFFWGPTDVDWKLFESDWTFTRSIVASSKAETLTEKQAQALAARRKGTGGPSDKGRPQYDPKAAWAPSRAWALKTCFTRGIYEERRIRDPSLFVSVLDVVGAGPPGDVLANAERKVLEELFRDVGRTLREIAIERNIAHGRGKNLAATIVKKALGFPRVNVRITEFEKMGVEIKTLSVSASTGRLYEAVSFPAIVLKEFAEQAFEPEEISDQAGQVIQTLEGSDLAIQLRRILFIPTFGMQRKTPALDRRLGKPFFWTPSPDDWSRIRLEWEEYRREVLLGKALYTVPKGEKRRRNGLKKESQTSFIHMRPHGRKSSDEDIDPIGQRITKQCFWLNRKFVERLLRESGSLPPPPDWQDAASH